MAFDSLYNISLLAAEVRREKLLAKGVRCANGHLLVAEDVREGNAGSSRCEPCRRVRLTYLQMRLDGYDPELPLT